MEDVGRGCVCVKGESVGLVQYLTLLYILQKERGIVP